MYVLSLVMLVIDPSSTTTRNKQVHTEEDSNCSLKHPQRMSPFPAGESCHLCVDLLGQTLFSQFFLRFRLETPTEKVLHERQ